MCDTAHVAATRQHLLLGGLVGGNSEHRGGASCAVEGDGQPGELQVLRLDVGLDRIARSAVGRIHPGLGGAIIGLLRQCRGGGLAVVRGNKLLADRLRLLVWDGAPDRHRRDAAA